MLVLARRVNETLIIGNAKVRITRLHNGCVWLGIDAPQDVEIWREEVFKKRQAAQQEAGDGDGK